MERILTKDIVEQVGKQVRIAGWVANRRDHGKITFLDLRDRSGIAQLVGVKLETVPNMLDTVEVIGLVKQRPAKMVNPDLGTGTVEIEIESLKVLNPAAELPYWNDCKYKAKSAGSMPRSRITWVNCSTSSIRWLPEQISSPLYNKS